MTQQCVSPRLWNDPAAMHWNASRWCTRPFQRPRYEARVWVTQAFTRQRWGLQLQILRPSGMRLIVETHRGYAQLLLTKVQSVVAHGAFVPGVVLADASDWAKHSPRITRLLCQVTVADTSKQPPHLGTLMLATHENPEMRLRLAFDPAPFAARLSQALGEQDPQHADGDAP